MAVSFFTSACYNYTDAKCIIALSGCSDLSNDRLWCRFFVLFFSVLSIWPWCLRQITEYHSARCDMIFIYYIPRQNLHKSSFWWSALWGWIKKPQGFCWCFYILILIIFLWRCAGTVLGTWWCFLPTYLW